MPSRALTKREREKLRRPKKVLSGRVLSPSTIKLVCQMAAEGQLSNAALALAVGVSRQEFEAWLALGRGEGHPDQVLPWHRRLVKQLDAARLKAARTYMRAYKKGAEKDPKYAERWLARAFPDGWSDHVIDRGPTVTVNVLSVQELRELGPAELARRYREAIEAGPAGSDESELPPADASAPRRLLS